MPGSALNRMMHRLLHCRVLCEGVHWRVQLALPEGFQLGCLIPVHYAWTSLHLWLCYCRESATDATKRRIQEAVHLREEEAAAAKAALAGKRADHR